MKTKEVVDALNAMNFKREDRLTNAGKDLTETFAEEPVTMDRMEEI